MEALDLRIDMSLSMAGTYMFDGTWRSISWQLCGMKLDSLIKINHQALCLVTVSILTL